MVRHLGCDSSHQQSEFRTCQVRIHSGDECLSEMSTPVGSPAYYSKTYFWMIHHEVSHVEPEEDEAIVIPERFSRVFFGQDDTEFAGMANPEKRPDVASEMLIVDCGA